MCGEVQRHPQTKTLCPLFIRVASRDWTSLLLAERSFVLPNLPFSFAKPALLIERGYVDPFGKTKRPVPIVLSFFLFRSLPCPHKNVQVLPWWNC